MGSIQSSVNQMLGQAASLSKKAKSEPEVSKQVMETSQARLDKEKLARATQRANLEKQRAAYQQAKLKKQQAISAMKTNKMSADISIGGQKITDPQLLKRIKESM